MSLSKEDVSRALSILKAIIAEAESLEAVNGDELRILQTTADRMESPLFQTLAEVHRQQQEDIDCLTMERGPFCDDSDELPMSNTSIRQVQSQFHHSPHGAHIDEPDRRHDLSIHGEAGRDSDSTRAEVISPDFVSPVICDQDESAGTMHRNLLPLSSGKELEAFDPRSEPILPSFGEQTPPSAVVFDEGMSPLSRSRETEKGQPSFDEFATEGAKKDSNLDLLSPMREEKSLLAIKAAVRNRQSRNVTLVQPVGGLGLDIVGLTNVGLFVNGIQAGSVAEGYGQIRRGDQVLEVNGISCENLASFELSHMIKEFPLGTTITLALQHNPAGLEDYLRRYSQMRSSNQ